jgi:hypothetical protein
LVKWDTNETKSRAEKIVNEPKKLPGGNSKMSRLYRNLETGEVTADYGSALEWAEDEMEVGEFHIVTKFGGEM